MKMHSSYIALLAALVIVAGWAMSPRMTFQPESRIWVEGTSTLHDWTMTVARFSGSLEATDAQNIGQVKITVPVSELKSDNGKLDKNAHQALKASTHPNVTYELNAADLAAAAANNKFELTTTGRLTIAGVTKPVTFSVKGEQLTGGQTRYIGSVPVLMSAFGMKPPTAMLGTIKTGDKVIVHFDVLTAR